ncbi:MAG: hypothetical protein ACIAQZ_17030 [Sedimentisphaeraceae bacterium JB056]
MFKDKWRSFGYRIYDKRERVKQSLAQLLKVDNYGEYGDGILGVFRSWLKQHKFAGGVIFSILTIGFLLFTLNQLMPQALCLSSRELDEKVWFYDINTDELFTAPISSIPPIDAPSGPLPNGEAAGARAYVYKYVSEQGPEEQFIAYIEMFTPQAKKLMESKNRADRQKAWNQGRLIRKTDNTIWVEASSAAGKEITKFEKREQDDRFLMICFPE